MEGASQDNLSSSSAMAGYDETANQNASVHDAYAYQLGDNQKNMYYDNNYNYDAKYDGQQYYQQQGEQQAGNTYTEGQQYYQQQGVQQAGNTYTEGQQYYEQQGEQQAGNTYTDEQQYYEQQGEQQAGNTYTDGQQYYDQQGEQQAGNTYTDEQQYYEQQVEQQAGDTYTDEDYQQEYADYSNQQYHNSGVYVPGVDYWNAVQNTPAYPPGHDEEVTGTFDDPCNSQYVYDNAKQRYYNPKNPEEYYSCEYIQDITRKSGPVEETIVQLLTKQQTIKKMETALFLYENRKNLSQISKRHTQLPKVSIIKLKPRYKIQYPMAH